MSFHHHDAAISNVIFLAVLFQVVANLRPRSHFHVFVENGVLDFGAAADVAVIKDNGIVHLGSGVNSDATAQDGAANNAAGDNGAAGNDCVDRHTAAAILVKHEFGGRIEITRSAQGPLAVVEVELGRDRAQVHAGFVIGVNRTDVAPILR